MTGALVALERRHVEAFEQFGATIRDNLTFEIDRALERLEAMRSIRKVETRNLNQDTWRAALRFSAIVLSTIIPDASSSRFHVTIEQWLRLHGDAKNLFIQRNWHVTQSSLDKIIKRGNPQPSGRRHRSP